MQTHGLAPARVLLADDHGVFRDGVRLLLANDPAFTVVGEARTLDGLMAAVRLDPPDLLLIDYHMPGGDSCALVNHLRHTLPALRIVFLTGSSSAAVLGQMADVGAHAVLLKEGSAAELMTHLRAVLAGECVIPPEVAALIAQSDGLLTRREMQVVKLIADGLSNADMGALLCLSPKTVDKHRENLMRKLEVGSVAQLLRKAQAMGWLAS